MAGDEDARKARAAALRRQIARITKPVAGAEQRSEPRAEPGAPQETPRQFVHRRMRELDRDKKRRKK